MATIEQRVSYLEGKIEALATKEDLTNLRADLTWRMATLVILGNAAMVGAVAAVIRFVE